MPEGSVPTWALPERRPADRFPVIPPFLVHAAFAFAVPGADLVVTLPNTPGVLLMSCIMSIASSSSIIANKPNHELHEVHDQLTPCWMLSRLPPWDFPFGLLARKFRSHRDGMDRNSKAPDSRHVGPAVSPSRGDHTLTTQTTIGVEPRSRVWSEGRLGFALRFSARITSGVGVAVGAGLAAGWCSLQSAVHALESDTDSNWAPFSTITYFRSVPRTLRAIGWGLWAAAQYKALSASGQVPGSARP